MNILICNTFLAQYLGGSIISTGYLKRTYKNLVPHDTLYVSINFILTGNWQSSDWFSVDVDGVSSTRWSLAPAVPFDSTITCGSLHSGLTNSIIGIVLHHRKSVTITINFSTTQGSGLNSPVFGIRDVTLREVYNQPGESNGFYLTLTNSAVPDITYCNSDSYLATNSGYSSCQLCPTNRCDRCTGTQGTNCIRQAWASSYNGVSFSPCATNCMLCTGPGANDCVQRQKFYVLDYDNACKTQCTSPYQPIGTLFIKCLMPCNSDQYLYWNNTCRDSCNFPLQTDSNGEECIYPCNKAYAEFLYWNGLCSTICPYIQRNENGYGFCDRYAAGYYLYPDENLCKPDCNYPYTIQEFVLCELELSPSDKKDTAAMSRIMSAGDLAIGAGSAAVGFLNPGDPSAFALVALTKMLFYTRYMDIKFPSRVQSVLDQQKVGQPAMKFLQKARGLLEERLKKYPLPGRFDHYKLHSSFLVNFFEPAILFSAALLVALIFSLFSCNCHQANLLGTILRKIKDAIHWNLLVGLYISQHDGVILYSSLELRTTNSFNSFLSVLSFLASCTSVIFAAFLSLKMVIIIRALWIEIGQSGTQEQRFQRIADFTKKNGGFRVFYETFRHSSLIQHSFYLISTARLIMFHIIIAALIYHPFLQAILILLMSVLMVFYLCFKYPVQNKLKLVQYIIQEAILLVVNVCVLIVACVDLTGKESYSIKKIAGEIFLYYNMILSMLGPVVIVLMVVENLIALIKRRRGAESRAGVANSKDVIPNISAVVPQENPQPNNESNIMLFPTGVNQSQIHDISLKPSNYDSTSQAEGPMTNITELNSMNPSSRAENKKKFLENNKYRRRLDQSRMQKPSEETTTINETKPSNKTNIKISKPEDLGKPGPKKDEGSLHVSNKNFSHNHRLDSHSIPEGNAITLHGSRIEEEVEPSWLRANKDRQYRIRGVEQYFQDILLIRAAESESGKYINELTHGNHSGCINLLKIKRPRDLDLKQEKQ